MRKIIFTLLFLSIGTATIEAQTSKTEAIKQIRKIYAEAKEQIANNGKDGMAPLDIKIRKNDRTELSEDDFMSEVTELNFYFNKYRVNPELEYPDASSCYFITENWSANGHTRYREILFDPNEGYLLFSYMRAETHAGFTVETRYYYDADGRLIDDKHRIGGQESTANAHTWSSAEGDKALAQEYLEIFDELLNVKKEQATEDSKRVMAANAARMKYIRDTYATAKERISKNDKSEYPLDLQIIIRDQSWGPPETTDLKFYFEGIPGKYNCYFISKHHHNNQMGFDNYHEYLFTPKSNDLIFSYTRSFEEGEKNEWRYYYDKDGRCIEAKTNAAEHDGGESDKQSVERYLGLFKRLSAINE